MLTKILSFLGITSNSASSNESSIKSSKPLVNMTEFMKEVRGVRDSKGIDESIRLLENKLHDNSITDYDKLRILSETVGYQLKADKPLEAVKSFFLDTIEQLSLEENLDVQLRIAKTHSIFDKKDGLQNLISYLERNVGSSEHENQQDIIKCSKFLLSMKEHNWAKIVLNKGYLQLDPNQHCSTYVFSYLDLITQDKEICIKNRKKKLYKDFLYFEYMEFALGVIKSIYLLPEIRDFHRIKEDTQNNSLSLFSKEYVEAFKELGVYERLEECTNTFLDLVLKDLSKRIVEDERYLDGNLSVSEQKELRLNWFEKRMTENERNQSHCDLSFLSDEVNRFLSDQLPEFYKEIQ